MFKIEKNEEIFAKFPYFAWLFQKKVVSLQRILKCVIMLIEPTPAFSQAEAGAIGQKAFSLLFNADYQSLIRRINNDYLYWDKAKYHRPEDRTQARRME